MALFELVLNWVKTQVKKKLKELITIQEDLFKVDGFS